MKNKIYIFLCLIILTSCISNESNDLISEKRLTDFLNSKNIEIKNSNEKIVVIIPNAGCEGCISEGEKFLLQNLETFENNFVILLTNVNDMKKVKLRFDGTDFLSSKNVHVDNANYLGYISFYPEIVYFSKGKIIKREIQSPETPNAFENLKNHLKL